MTRFDLSAAELDVLWRAAGFGDLPLVIDVPSPGATHAERAVLEHRVWADLVARGLADDHGHAHWRLTDRLATIAECGRSLQLRTVGDGATGAILATRGRHNVLGVLGERFHLTAVPGTGRAATLVSLLPELPAGQGHSVSVDTAVFTSAAAGPAGAHDTLRRHGLGTDDARTLLAMTTGAVRITQLVTERRGDGVERSRPVSVLDTAAGRYRVIRTVTSAGDHLTVTPATAASLVEALTFP
ncbi:ESX secretion-associated protein EspG [Actinophytocola glycyrrhizae]|uniref:ESX secretion-associated protein EspG n=1 Tax=Actinophytocola glycyrrhizae TaxID=2044873 RepID=A0ABV9SC15_9PSEU